MTDQTAIVVLHGGFIAPVADVQTALRRYQAVKDFIGQVLKENTDYGKIPGSDKPALYKAGAEKMTAFFGFTVRFILTEKVEDWTGEAHGGEPFFYYSYRAQLWRENLIAEGDGSCNSWETKYRYRNSERKCPACGQAKIIKGREEYGGGWLCFAKKGGCGAKFSDGNPAIESQQVGQIKNPDPADLVNTIQKMAQKRALVAPVLIATNTSDYFTQDLDDFIDATARDVTPPTTTKPTAPEPKQPEPDRPEPEPEAQSDPIPAAQDTPWPAVVLSDCVKNRWVSTEAKAAEVLGRSKFVTPETPTKYLLMWVSFYTDDRKHSLDAPAAEAADNKVANLMSAK